MDRTLVVCASYRGVELRTQACMAALQKHGARLLSGTGIPDVALARNNVLTRALAQRGSCDVFLLVDDDMVWTLGAAAKLVGLARQTGEAWSAAYATKEKHLAATPLEWDAQRTDGLCMVGLGMCAVPVAKLEALALELGVVVGPNNSGIVPFCQCRVVTPEHDHIPRWCSEDYWLSRALGGVRLAPIAVGHLKQMDIWPDDETIKRLAEGIPLDAPDAPAPSAEPPPPSSPPAPPAPTKPDNPTSKRKKKRSKRNGATQAQP